LQYLALRDIEPLSFGCNKTPPVERCIDASFNPSCPQPSGMECGELLRLKDLHFLQRTLHLYYDAAPVLRSFSLTSVL
jgi:hypothetical protein